MSVDLFDDPPWTSSPAADRHQGRWSAIATLAVCLLGAVGVAIGTTLPWFGLDESLGVGFLHLQDQMSALSRYLQPAQFGSLSPGTQESGILHSGALVRSGDVSHHYSWNACCRAKDPFRPVRGCGRSCSPARYATVLEAHAKPPFGDGPPLRFSWGAVVGVAAATISLIGACSAVVLRH